MAERKKEEEFTNIDDALVFIRNSVENYKRQYTYAKATLRPSENGARWRVDLDLTDRFDEEERVAHAEAIQARENALVKQQSQQPSVDYSDPKLQETLAASENPDSFFIPANDPLTLGTQQPLNPPYSEDQTKLKNKQVQKEEARAEENDEIAPEKPEPKPQKRKKFVEEVDHEKVAAEAEFAKKVDNAENGVKS